MGCNQLTGHGEAFIKVQLVFQARVRIACEQALCLGKNSKEREGKGEERPLFAFPSPHPARLKASSQARVRNPSKSVSFQAKLE